MCVLKQLEKEGEDGKQDKEDEAAGEALYVWVRGCVGAWVRGCVGAWVRGWCINIQMYVYMYCIYIYIGEEGGDEGNGDGGKEEDLAESDPDAQGVPI
jgi:hypothetical protein